MGSDEDSKKATKASRRNAQKFFVSSAMVEKMFDLVTARQKNSEEQYAEALEIMNNKLNSIIDIREQDIPEMNKVIHKEEILVRKALLWIAYKSRQYDKQVTKKGVLNALK